MRYLILGCAVLVSNSVYAKPKRHKAKAAKMTIAKLDALLRQVDPKLRHAGSAWELTFKGVRVMCIADARADRMRLISPVARVDQVNEAQFRRAMEANFHTSLDARYATSNGVLYSAFLHPLSTLAERDLASAIYQVAVLAMTYGTSYSSGMLQFGKTKPASRPSP